VIPSAVKPATQNSFAGGSVLEISYSTYVSMSGTDTLTLVATMTGAAGTLNSYGNLRILAV